MITTIRMMMGLLLCTALQVALPAQSKFFTRNGQIAFDAEGITDYFEEIKALNKEAVCVLDLQSGKMEWAVRMKGFHFKNGLMEEHFNENYVESEQYPKAVFKGDLAGLPDKEAFQKAGSWPVTAKGLLTLHGVTHQVTSTGSIQSNGEGLHTVAAFSVKLEDYNIKIPSIVGSKIAEVVDITVDASLEPLKK